MMKPSASTTTPGIRKMRHLAQSFPKAWHGIVSRACGVRSTSVVTLSQYQASMTTSI